MPTRSPLKDKTLRQAGESLHERARDLIDQEFFPWLAMTAGISCVATVETLWRIFSIPFNPWVWPTVSVALICFTVYRWRRIEPQVKTMMLGVHGERQVGRMLEAARSPGYEVFHDIAGKDFNIDHALIGPGGVFAIETKTWSKPEGRNAKIDYDGERVLIDGQTPDRDPVRQAAAVADYLRDLLQGMTGRRVDVRPVVLFPGWWISKQPRGARVWVLSPKGLLAFLKNEPAKLSPEDVALFVNRLTLHLSTE